MAGEQLLAPDSAVAVRRERAARGALSFFVFAMIY
jgi:hypothetical protein